MVSNPFLFLKYQWRKTFHWVFIMELVFSGYLRWFINRHFMFQYKGWKRQSSRQNTGRIQRFQNPEKNERTGKFYLLPYLELEGLNKYDGERYTCGCLVTEINFPEESFNAILVVFFVNARKNRSSFLKWNPIPKGLSFIHIVDCFCQDKAATKIQANFRGYKTRKLLVVAKASVKIKISRQLYGWRTRKNRMITLIYLYIWGF